MNFFLQHKYGVDMVFDLEAQVPNEEIWELAGQLNSL